MHSTISTKLETPDSFSLKSELMRRVFLASQRKPYRGIGELWRMASQYCLLRKWERKYAFRSACEVPYQSYVWGVDGLAFDCPYVACRNFYEVKEKFDLVWNFCVVQQNPKILFDMIRCSNKYVASFVPNSLNVGRIIHDLYHFIHDTKCMHPDRGSKSLMTLNGLKKLFDQTGVKILEAGYCDMPPFPDWVISIKNFFKAADVEGEYKPSKTLQVLEEIFWFDQTNPMPKRIWAHHPYVLGVI